MAGTGFGVFSIASPETALLNSSGVDDTGRIIRQRQHHNKSRRGCMRCKSRRVKCDESQPTCRKCSMRGEECIFESFHDSTTREIRSHQRNQNVTPKPASSSVAEASSMPDNLVYQTGTRTRRQHPAPDICHVGTSSGELMSLRLMYHFEHFTSDTLLFGKLFWRDQILPLALHHDYLMHAVLTISAAHLDYLLPQLADNKRAMNIHLSHTLPGFRHGVGTIASLQDSDAVIACGFLLLYYAWYVPFFHNEMDDPNPSMDSDGLLSFATGLNEVITAAYEVQQSRNSTNTYGIFQIYAIPQYIRMISDMRTRTASAAAGWFSYDFEGNFLGRHKLTSHQLQDQVATQREEEGGPRGCREIKLEDRLDPIFYAVDSFTLGLDLTEIMPSFMVYSLTWPTKAPKEFVREVQAGSPQALLVLLIFYASLWLTLSSSSSLSSWSSSHKVWWAHHRCRMMCEFILAQLTSSQRTTTSFLSENIAHIVEYFKFKQNANGAWEVGSPSLVRP